MLSLSAGKYQNLLKGVVAMQKAKKKRKVYRTLIRMEGRNTRSARNKSLVQGADKNIVGTFAENYSFSAGNFKHMK
jgi:hypothetical protein